MSDGTAGFELPASLSCAHPTVVHPSVGSERKSACTSTSSSTPDFSGLWIPLVTPFRGRCGRPCRAGCAGRSGSRPRASPASWSAARPARPRRSTRDEQLAVLATVAQAAPALPRIMGISGYHLGKTARVGAPAERRKVSPGCWCRHPATSGLRRRACMHWFEAIAEASAVPILIYDIPYRTGATIDARDAARARGRSAHPRPQGLRRRHGQDAGADRRRPPAGAGRRGRADLLRRWPRAAPAPSRPARTCRPRASCR